MLLSSWNSSVLNKWPGFSFCTRNCKWCSLFPSIIWKWIKTRESPSWASALHCDFCLLQYFPGLSCQLQAPWSTQGSYLRLLALTVMTLFYSCFATYPWISLVWKDSSFNLTHISFLSSCNKFCKLSYLEKRPRAFSCQSLLAMFKTSVAWTQTTILLCKLVFFKFKKSIKLKSGLHKLKNGLTMIKYIRNYLEKSSIIEL